MSCRWTHTGNWRTSLPASCSRTDAGMTGPAADPHPLRLSDDENDFWAVQVDQGEELASGCRAAGVLTPGLTPPSSESDVLAARSIRPGHPEIGIRPRFLR